MDGNDLAWRKEKKIYSSIAKRLQGGKISEATLQYPTESEVLIDRPKQLEQMLDLARILAEDFLFWGIDFYSIGNKVYFWKITFFLGSGFEGFQPIEWNRKYGE